MLNTDKLLITCDTFKIWASAKLQFAEMRICPKHLPKLS